MTFLLSISRHNDSSFILLYNITSSEIKTLLGLTDFVSAMLSPRHKLVVQSL